MTSTTEEVNKFIEANTNPAFGTWQSYIRTRDALIIALTRMESLQSTITMLSNDTIRSEARAAQLEAERDDLRRQLVQSQETILSMTALLETKP